MDISTITMMMDIVILAVALYLIVELIKGDKWTGVEDEYVLDLDHNPKDKPDGFEK